MDSERAKAIRAWYDQGQRWVREGYEPQFGVPQAHKPLIPPADVFALLDMPHDAATMKARHLAALESAFDAWQRYAG